MEALDALKSIRDDIIVRMFETDESATSRWSVIGYPNKDDKILIVVRLNLGLCLYCWFELHYVIA